MTHSDTETEGRTLLHTTIRAAVLAPVRDLLATNITRISRRSPDVSFAVRIDEPHDGGWCFVHGTAAPDPVRDPDLARNCGYGSEFDKCAIRPAQLVQIAVTATGLPLIDGDWETIGILSTDSEGVTTAASFGDEDSRVQDHAGLAGRCFHCNTPRDRRSTLLVRHAGTGDVQPLGLSCARELTGGAVRDGFVKLLTDLRETFGRITRSGGACNGEAAPTLDVIALAAAYIARFGFVRSNDGTKDNPSTKERVSKALTWTENGPRPEIVAADLTLADLDRAQAHIDELAAWDEDSDFAYNLRQIAASEWIEIAGRRPRVGFAVCIPDAARRASERRARQEQWAAEKTAKAAAATPAPTGRLEFEGVVQSRRLVTQWTPGGDRPVWKMRVQHDAGWAVWVSIPSEIAAVTVGSRIRLTATLKPSNPRDGEEADPLFAIGSVPKKAEVLVPAAI